MGAIGLPELLIIVFVLGLVAVGVAGLVILLVVLSRRKKDPPVH